MKRIFIIFIVTISFLLFTIGYSYAATTPTPSVQPTKTPSGTQNISGLDQQIDNLKDRIASRVAQLKLVQKRGIFGTVTDVAETQLTITDLAGKTRFIDVDELTKFASPSAKGSFGISDITKGSTVGILGLFNKESERILGRFVTVQTLPTIISGIVTNKDAKEFTLTVTSIDLKDFTVDVGDITKTYVYDSTSGLNKSGFSKITANERVMIVGFPDQKNPKEFIASRIIRMPSVAVNPRIPLFKPGEMNVTPSTGSGTKLVPIIKQSK